MINWKVYTLVCLASIALFAYAVDLRFFSPAQVVIPAPRRVVSHTDSDHFEPECATPDSIRDYLEEQRCRIDERMEDRRRNLEIKHHVEIPKRR